MSAIYLQPFASYDVKERPPAFAYEPSHGHLKPDDELVISMRSGTIISRYGDDVWDLSPYGAKESKLNFTTITLTTLKKEAKRLTYLYMTHRAGKGRTLPSGATIAQKYYSFIKPLAEHIQHLPNNIQSFNEIFSSPKRLRRFIITSTNNALYKAAYIQTILNLLNNVSINRSGFNYIHDKNNMKIIGILKRKSEDAHNQTLLIPVEIYSNAAKGRWNHINFIHQHTKKLASFIADFATCKGFGAASSSSLTPQERKQYIHWDDAVKTHALETLFNEYHVTGSSEFLSFITSIQITCRHLIHQYTGMRDNECRSLAQDCWRDKNSEMPSRIHGIEQKIHGVPTQQVWITHDTLKRVIDLLSSINEPMNNKICPQLKNPPLIIKASLLRKELEVTHNDELKVPRSCKNDVELPLDAQSITLSQEHIDEMSLVDDRDWNEHEWIKVGSAWQFNTHQYRRALAVYALGSGLVSLHAIKEQFGHLISAMTAYYANGYKSVRKLDGSINEANHIARYMLSIKSDIKFYSYRKNVLLSKTPLYGANGMHLEKHIVAKTTKEREIVMRSSDELKKEFKKSGKYYEDTAMGGCTNPICEKILLPNFFIHCRGCESSIHKLDKIEKLSEKQRQVAMKWAEIHPEGIDHRTAVKLAIEIENFANVLRRKEEKESI